MRKAGVRNEDTIVLTMGLPGGGCNCSQRSTANHWHYPTSGDEGSPTVRREGATPEAPSADVQDSAVQNLLDFDNESAPPRETGGATDAGGAVDGEGEDAEEMDDQESYGSVTPPNTFGQQLYDNGLRDLSPRTVREIVRRNVERWRTVEMRGPR